MKFNFLSRLFSKIPTLETDRILLRELKRSDAKDVYEYSANPKTSEFLLWEVHKSQEYTKEFIDYVISKYKSGEYNDWALVYKFNNKMIGTCGFTKIDQENNVAEIGYVINPEYWNLGLATEAAEAVIKFAFDTMKMNRVEAKFMYGNDASLAVMRKLGMKFEGYHRDMLFVKGKDRTIGYAAILRSEYDRRF